MKAAMSDSQIPPRELREHYLRATPRQRYQVALQRIENASSGPSLLVNVMSALEGFTRSVAVRQRVDMGETYEQAYPKVRNVGPVDLLSEHVCPTLETTPEEAFGPEAWSALPDAVDFRNLLVHEATYLHGGTCKRLTDAARHILDTLARIVGAA